MTNSSHVCGGQSDYLSFDVPSECQASTIEATVAWEYSAQIQLIRSELSLGSNSGECSSCNTIIPQTFNPTTIPAGSVQIQPLCLTGVGQPISFWEISNTNSHDVVVYLSRRGSSNYTAFEIASQSKVYFETSSDREEDIYELSILNGQRYILVDSSSPPTQNCPVIASGCCDQLTIKNPNPFSISILYEVYSLQGVLETLSPLIMYPCGLDPSACTYVIPGVSMGSSLIVHQQTLSGQLASEQFSRFDLEKDCPSDCAALTTTGFSTSGSSGTTGTSGTTGSTGVTTWFPITSGSSTGSEGTCKHQLQCVNSQSVWDWNLCRCSPCPLDNTTCENEGKMFDPIVCSCNKTESNGGGGGSQTNKAAITGGTVTAGTVAGAAAAALYFLAKRKKQPEEEVIDADLTFANVIESNPLYQDPMPTYDNPIYEGGDHGQGHGHEDHAAF